MDDWGGPFDPVWWLGFVTGVLISIALRMWIRSL